MLDPANKDSYILHRMVPPGNLSYYYSYLPPKDVEMTIETSAEKENLQVAVPKMNHIENSAQLTRVITVEQLKQWKPIPRPEPEEEIQALRPKTPWSFPISLFAQYRQDTDAHLANCFDFDWRCSKIDKLIKAAKDKDAIYVFLRDNYKAM